MSLYWPPDAAVCDGPRLHALVVGVGAYPHLYGGDARTSTELSSLGQLASPVPTALRIARWLAEEHVNPDGPVGSVELVLSPAQPVDRPDGSTVEVEGATEAALQGAAERWFERCDTHADNTALFYFVGHGLQSSASSNQLLLPADVGASAANPWRHFIDFDETRRGMRRCRAETQLYFVDACDEYSVDTETKLDVTGTALVSGGDFGDQVRTVATYRAARAGRRAFAPADGGLTYFAQTLLETLGGTGASFSIETGEPEVTTHDLGRVLAQLKDYLFDAKTAAKLSWRPEPAGALAVVHRPPAARVRTTVRCAEPGRDAEAAFRLERGPETHTSARGDDRPWVHHIQPGDWRAEATFPDGAPLVRERAFVNGAVSTIRL